MSESKSSITHIGISVADLDASLKWYKEHFGFEETRRFTKPEFEMKGAALSDGRIGLEVIMPSVPVKRAAVPASLAEALRQCGANHLALDVDDVTVCYERLRSAGAQLITEIIGGRFFFCADPDGTLLEVRQG
jgi:catechol 2,3-dioxygenase-like lactoylglutathione lyase family enzyme